MLSVISAAPWRSTEKRMKIRPDYAEAYYNLGIALDAVGQHADARYNDADAARSRPTCRCDSRVPGGP